MPNLQYNPIFIALFPFALSFLFFFIHSLLVRKTRNEKPKMLLLAVTLGLQVLGFISMGLTGWLVAIISVAELVKNHGGLGEGMWGIVFFLSLYVPPLFLLGFILSDFFYKNMVGWNLKKIGSGILLGYLFTQVLILAI